MKAGESVYSLVKAFYVPCSTSFRQSVLSLLSHSPNQRSVSRVCRLLCTQSSALGFHPERGGHWLCSGGSSASWGIRIGAHQHA